MSLTAKGGEFKEREPVPEGSHPAVCVGVIDLGTQTNEVYGGARHEVLVMWELPEVRIEWEKDGHKTNLPRSISRRFTLSLNPKANLCPFLEAWRGKKFTPQELDGFDVGQIAGHACFLGVVHKPSPKGGMRAVVASVMPWPRTMQAAKPKAEGRVIAWDLDEMSGPELPAELPEWVRDVIKKSAEYRAMIDKVPGERGAVVEDEGDGEVAPF